MSWHSIKQRHYSGRYVLKFLKMVTFSARRFAIINVTVRPPPRMEMAGFSGAEIKRHFQTFLNLIADEEMSLLRSPFLCQSSLSPLSSEKNSHGNFGLPETTDSFGVWGSQLRSDPDP